MSLENDVYINMSDLQRRHKEWTVKRFGNRIKLEAAAGVCEESSELLHAIGIAISVKSGKLLHDALKAHQRDRGRRDKRYDEIDFEAEIQDGAGDIIMFLMDLANICGFDLGAVLLQTFEHVTTR